MEHRIHRDPRRLFSEAQRRDIHSRQAGACHGCGQPLQDPFDVHHVVPWALGGPTHIDNAIGVCKPCHRTQPVHVPPGITPRQWQIEAMNAVLEELANGQFVTIAAAPGAGKTLFTALVVQELLARGAVERVSVFVPNGNLRTQWAVELGRVGIPLQPDPRYLIETDGHAGNVLTYAKLNDANLSRLKKDERRTLYVLDEVHHLGRDEEGQHKAWANKMGELVGTVENPQQPVLNLTGTPFRSVERERIATCRYRQSGDSSIELATDYKITSSQLIAEGHLRHLQVHSWDAGLKIVNLADGEERANRVLDLDAIASSERSAALRSLVNDVEGFVAPVLSALVDVLSMQQESLQGHHVKGLVICDTAKQAELVYATAKERLQMPKGALMKAVADEGAEAKRAIEDFRTSAQPSILVAIRMVSEGFDAPDVSAIAYMSKWTAPLFIAQMVARAMRVTQVERALGFRIPAEVIIPSDPAMLEAFNRVLVDEMRLLDIDPDGPPCPICNRPALTCYCNRPIMDKMCGRCGMPRKICPCPKDGGNRPLPLVQVSVTEAAQRAGLHRDGESVDMRLLDVFARTAGKDLDASQVPGATLALQRMIEENPFLMAQYMRGEGR